MGYTCNMQFDITFVHVKGRTAIKMCDSDIFMSNQVMLEKCSMAICITKLSILLVQVTTRLDYRYNLTKLSILLVQVTTRLDYKYNLTKLSILLVQVTTRLDYRYNHYNKCSMAICITKLSIRLVQVTTRLDYRYNLTKLSILLV